MSYLAIFFLLYLSLHACNAHRLGFSAKENGNHVDFLASKDANKLKGHKLEMGPSISKKLQTPELQEVRSHGRRIIDAKTMKQTISDSFLAKEAVQNAISGYGIMSSSRVGLQSKETVEGWKRIRARSMLGNSDAGADEALDSKEKDNVRDIDVMDYAQPHRKPPIHNEKLKN
ncbi:hypothetical protein ERO13_D08G190400v2 [Gossypium hirsutum]|uniref:Uncharacterized protein isoform X2 n=5 Tax=Gossypium TaxID=3633 RepID=A0A1U8LVS6_GOSHI|nr:uncharacterized protein LOC107931283 isoform X2 [Gossypium hirsutum]KAB2018127.1 hypothetical protein ES319_D08G207800v1 [Gossypium barbadense]TYG58396.1 hypothetical protein ES288_D08G218900v1 [Gossypium darwinii]TYH59349.1 hypothetical protein ES332_D08G216200v1 [Gossypium tomentosum]TYI70275.1 hypothetical protein E1A91_D08G209900v1 [Gossypium mustelinum]KAG4135027.1 hypothetical protein ERO13_D08G190400v2 [Gossypium hirsutum]